MAIGRTNAQNNKDFRFAYSGAFKLNDVDGVSDTKTVAKGDWVLKLLTTGILTVYHCGTKVDYYVLGGGGAGGNGKYESGTSFSGSGGGGGYTKNVYGAKINYATIQSKTINVTIGASVGNSSLLTTTAPHGNSGAMRTGWASASTDGAGGAGGSGGAGATGLTNWQWTTKGASGGAGGNNGANGNDGKDENGASGGGHGAGGKGQRNTTDYGYNTYPFTDSDYGTNFGVGGKAGDVGYNISQPVAGGANTGNGGGGGRGWTGGTWQELSSGAAGGSGIVIIRNARS